MKRRLSLTYLGILSALAVTAAPAHAACLNPDILETVVLVAFIILAVGAVIATGM